MFNLRPVSTGFIVNVIRQQINLNLYNNIVTPIVSWVLSWFQITSLSKIINLKAALKYKMSMKVHYQLYQHFVKLSRGSENLSITGCMFLFVYCTMLSIIFYVKKRLNNKDVFFTDFAARRRPGFFLYAFSASLLWIWLSLLLFHSIFTFFLESVYSKLYSACDGALS